MNPWVPASRGIAIITTSAVGSTSSTFFPRHHAVDLGHGGSRRAGDTDYLHVECLGLARDVLTDAAHAEDHHARAIGRDHVAGHGLPCPITLRTQGLEPAKTPHDAQHQGDGVAGQNPLAHVAAIGDPDTLGQPRSMRDIDAYSRELYPLERLTLVAHQPRELRREGGIVDVEDFRAGEGIGQAFDAVRFNRFDFGKFSQEGFVHHIIGGVHELGNANCHSGSTRSRYTRKELLVSNLSRPSQIFLSDFWE